MMRRLAACGMAAMLVAAVTVCPLLACPLRQNCPAPSRPVCHHKQSHSAPCTHSAQDCPYTILAKSDRNTAGWDGVALQAARILPGLVRPACPRSEDAGGRLIDSAGLFLRHRVLLI